MELQYSAHPVLWSGLESMMPWEQYKNMNDDDLRSIYRYLKSIPRVENNQGIILPGKMINHLFYRKRRIYFI